MGWEQGRQSLQAAGQAGRHLTPAELVLRNSRTGSDGIDSDEEAAIRRLPRSSPELRVRRRPPLLVATTSQPPPPLLQPGGGGARALLNKYSVSGGPTALAPPAMGWGLQASAAQERRGPDLQSRRVSWKAVDDAKGSSTMLPVRTGSGNANGLHSGGGAADLSSSDDAAKGDFGVPAVKYQPPIAEPEKGPVGLDMVIMVVERLKER